MRCGCANGIRCTTCARAHNPVPERAECMGCGNEKHPAVKRYAATVTLKAEPCSYPEQTIKVYVLAVSMSEAVVAAELLFNRGAYGEDGREGDIDIIGINRVS